MQALLAKLTQLESNEGKDLEKQDKEVGQLQSLVTELQEECATLKDALKVAEGTDLTYYCRHFIILLICPRNHS